MGQLAGWGGQVGHGALRIFMVPNRKPLRESLLCSRQHNSTESDNPMSEPKVLEVFSDYV
jgi:hypothetical protein